MKRLRQSFQFMSICLLMCVAAFEDKTYHECETTDKLLMENIISEMNMQVENSQVCAIHASNLNGTSFSLNDGICSVSSFIAGEKNQFSTGSISTSCWADRPSELGCSISNGGYISHGTTWIENCHIFECDRGSFSDLFVEDRYCDPDKTGLMHICPWNSPYQVWCDGNTDGGGWTVIQRRNRQKTREDFVKSFQDYENGFGKLDGEFWLGNSKIFDMTGDEDNFELRVELIDYDHESVYAHYTEFYLASPSSTYMLNINGYSGNAGDSMGGQNGEKFRVYEDTDYFGGWWYTTFSTDMQANLNGAVYADSYDNAVPEQGIIWSGWKLNTYSLKSTVMMIRRVP